MIDTDPGGDDALAIMLALMYEVKTHDIEIIAITATYGNTYLKNVEENVLKILTVANRSDVSKRPNFSDTHIHAHLKHLPILCVCVYIQ